MNRSVAPAWRKLTVPSLLACAVFSACSSSSHPPVFGETRSLRDGLGRGLQLPARVTRVVSLAPSTTEILYAIGAGDRVVGVDRYSNWPPEVARITRLGADLDPNIERIVALKPDVVFTATSANPQRTVELLERLHIPVFVSQSRTLADIYNDIRLLGRAVGCEPAANELVARMQARIEAVRRRRRERSIRTLVLVWTQPLVVAGRSSHVSDLLDAAGGLNLADDEARTFPTYSLERLLAQAPDAIVVGTHADAAPSLEPLERLTSLPAARRRRLYTLDGDLLFRPGPRVVEAVESLAALLHPEGAAGADAAPQP